MFVTLEEFFNDYRIKNGKQPNETVLNRGLMRLKRESREIESLMKIFTGQELNEWDSLNYYEVDEYVQYNGLKYRSRISNNLNNIPVYNDTVNWELITLNQIDSGNGNFEYKEYTALDAQTQFITPFNMEGTPMVWVEGILLDTSRYNKVSNTEIEIINGTSAGETVIISSGVAHSTEVLFAKNTFTAIDGQVLFKCSYEVMDPSVFVDGILQNPDDYIWYTDTVEFTNITLTGGEKIIIGNGNILGSDFYSKLEIDNMISGYVEFTDVYTKSEIDNVIADFSTETYVDNAISTLDGTKADTATTLSGYGITDAYTQAQTDAALGLKLDVNTYTGADILLKLETVAGAGSGLDADLIDGLESKHFIRSDLADGKIYNFSAATVEDPNVETPVVINEIVLNVEATEPQININKYVSGALDETATVYTDKNTSEVMIIREGYFKGSWDVELDNTFGITNYSDYNWTVSITPTLIGTEHDYNKDHANDHTPFTGFDNTISDVNTQSEYKYAYLDGNIVRLESIHRDGTTLIDIPARYHLIGVLKTFSTYAQINQP